MLIGIWREHMIRNVDFCVQTLTAPFHAVSVKDQRTTTLEFQEIRRDVFFGLYCIEDPQLIFGHVQITKSQVLARP